MCGLAWMAGWREIDWRGNGLIVLALAAGMQIALQEQRKRRLLQRGKPCVRGANEILLNNQDKNSVPFHLVGCNSLESPRRTCWFLFRLHVGGKQEASGADSVIRQPGVK